MQEDLSETQNTEISIGGFHELPLSPIIQEAVDAIGYETPSPIQKQAIPLLAEGRDLLGIAQTGTGKTAAFSLPLLGKVDTRQNDTQILCLTPTRELAIQVAEAMEMYGQKLNGLSVLAIYGGTEYGGQLRGLKKGAHVVVGTPGRVMDHVKRGSLTFDNLQAVVLDEADEMLSMGFIEDVEWLLEHTPSDRQTALFSATMPKAVAKLCEKYLNNPAQIRIKVQADAKQNIRQRFLRLRQNEKADALLSLLDIEDYDGLLIFARTKAATSELAETLLSKGFNAEALNGDMPQSLREKTVDRLKTRKLDILVATDVAARGLDVERITHVVNFDAPFDVESYVHRIGRTGRAGRSGDAILFVCGKEMRILTAITKTLKFDCTPYQFPTLRELNNRKKEQFFESINLAREQDIQEYRDLIENFLSSYDSVSPEELAATIAYLHMGSKPFYLKSAPSFEKQKADFRENEIQPKPDSRKGRGRFEEDDESDFDTYRVEVGTEHNVQKGDLVGAFANEAGLNPKHIGRIKLFQEFALIDLPKGMPKEIYQELQNLRVRGKKLEIRRDRKRAAAGNISGRNFSKGSNRGKPVNKRRNRRD